MRMGHDFGIGEFAHLVADLFIGVLEARIAEGRRARIGRDQFGEPCPHGGGVAAHHQLLHGIVEEDLRLVMRDAQIAHAHRFALAHRNAAGYLREILAESGLDDQRLEFAEPALLRHPRRIGSKLAQRLHIGREPGKAMHRELLLFDQRRRNLAVFRDLRENRGFRLGEEGIRRFHGAHRRRQKVVEKGGAPSRRGGGCSGVGLAHGANSLVSDIDRTAGAPERALSWCGIRNFAGKRGGMSGWK